MTYKKILVPHAGTEAGDKALVNAEIIAKCTSAEIIMLHVLEPAPIPSPLIFSSSKEKIDEYARRLINSVRIEMQYFLDERVNKISKCRVQEFMS